ALVFFAAGSSMRLRLSVASGAAALAAVAAVSAVAAALGAGIGSWPLIGAVALAVACIGSDLPTERTVGWKLPANEKQTATTAGSLTLLIAAPAALTMVESTGHDRVGTALTLSVSVGLTALAMIGALRWGSPEKPWWVPVAVISLAAALIGPAWAVWVALIGGLVVGRSRSSQHAPQTEPWFHLAEALVFVYAALRVDLTAVSNGWICLGVLILFSDVRSAGAALALRWSGRDWAGALSIATAMIRGGPVCLVVAVALLETDLINADIYLGLVLANLLTALLVAPMIGWLKKTLKETDPAAPLPSAGSKSESE
ncbi:MAG: hypothetical protein R3236_11550, partial [Phycisphaeraceae bacterium]|nr:hypothetical protein [Phycisphaeraceae bacterium]